MKKILFLILLIIFSISSYSVTTVRIISKHFKDDMRNEYYVNLLELALEKTKDKYGTYEIIDSTRDVSQSRIVRELQKDNLIDVMWSMTSIEREERLHAIRIPLLKGLMGNRILIINKINAEKFEKISSLDELKHLHFAQGHDWPDTKILQYNGFNVTKVTDYSSIFRILKSDRTDSFPRGVMEPWGELEHFNDGSLTVEKSILIQYFAPMYFFVNKNNFLLSKRIEEGLNTAINDGSFNDVFYSQNSIKLMFTKAKLADRKVFKLNNPFLTKETKSIESMDKYIYKKGDELKFYKH